MPFVVYENIVMAEKYQASAPDQHAGPESDENHEAPPNLDIAVGSSKSTPTEQGATGQYAYISIRQMIAYQDEWCMKVFVLRKGSIEVYTKEKETEVLRILLCDKEGGKIQAALFKGTIERFFDILHKGKAYRISNGSVRAIKPNLPNVNKEVEIIFTPRTEVTEIDDFVPYDISNMSYVDFSQIPNFIGTDKYLDIIGAIVTAKPIFFTRNRADQLTKKRDIVLTNTSKETIKLTLWGDLAENEGQLLEENAKTLTVITVHNVKASIYEGEVSLAATWISYLFINPNMGKALELKKSLSGKTKETLFAMVMGPSKRMREAPVVSLDDIILGNVKALYCSFIAKVRKVLNKNSPWFESCSLCNARVFPIGNMSVASCLQCKIDNAQFIRRYVMKLAVYQGGTEATITLFDAAEVLVGCGAVEFAKEIVTGPKEESLHYRNLVLVEDKELQFLVRMDKKGELERNRKQIVVQEVHKTANGRKMPLHGDNHELDPKKKMKLEK